MDRITIGVLRVGDGCGKNEAIEQSGPNLVRMIENGIIKNGTVTKMDLVADRSEDIEKKVKEWSDDGLQIILTTGGTGVGKTDVSPLEVLNRALAGVQGKTLVINLPGSKKASQECLEAVAGVIPCVLDLISRRNEKVQSVHESLEQKKSSVSVGDNLETHYRSVSVCSAQELTMKKLYMLRNETVLWYKEAHGHFSAEDLVVHEDIPPFNVSLRDGYAVLSTDQKSERNVVGESKVEGSSTNLKVLPGDCVRVSKGAPVPPYADAVIQVEDPEILEGQCVRLRGSVFKKGQLLLSSGTYLDSAAIDVLTRAGVTSVKVFQKPSVAIMFVADELANPDLELERVKDISQMDLMSLLKEEDFQAKDLGIVPNEPDALLNALERAFRAADVVVTTGSMSMRERNYLKQVLVSDFNAEICFEKVRMEPVAWTCLAFLVFEKKPKLLFRILGNTDAVFVSSQLLLLPALRKISGNQKPFPIVVRTDLDKVPSLHDDPRYVRAVLTYDRSLYCWTATVPENQGNPVNANCLLELPIYRDRKDLLIRNLSDKTLSLYDRRKHDLDGIPNSRYIVTALLTGKILSAETY